MLIEQLGGKCCACEGEEDLIIYQEDDETKVMCQECAGRAGIVVSDNVCDAHMTRNNQVTVGAPVRKQLDINPGDLVFFQVLRVISPEGKTKYGGS